MHEGKKTPLEMALEREANGELLHGCIECEYCRVIRSVGYCGISGKLLHPMMYEGTLRCKKREEARKMGLSISDVSRMGPAAQKQILAKVSQDAVEKQTKYHNQKAQRTMPSGKVYTFDSQKEARRYDELMLLLQAGRIRKLELQRQFTLQESYITPDGKRVRAIRYVADFVYERPTEPDCTGTVHWLRVVEDVKGVRTKEYQMKQKMMQERFGITIKEV